VILAAFKLVAIQPWIILLHNAICFCTSAQPRNYFRFEANLSNCGSCGGTLKGMAVIRSQRRGPWKTAALAAALIAAAVGLSGCPALFIPGLAASAVYEAYKYEKSSQDSSKAAGQDRRNRYRQSSKADDFTFA
jgi:hypothetical protein